MPRGDAPEERPRSRPANPLLPTMAPTAAVSRSAAERRQARKSAQHAEATNHGHLRVRDPWRRRQRPRHLRSRTEDERTDAHTAPGDRGKAAADPVPDLHAWCRVLEFRRLRYRNVRLGRLWLRQRMRLGSMRLELTRSGPHGHRTLSSEGTEPAHQLLEHVTYPGSNATNRIVARRTLPSNSFPPVRPWASTRLAAQDAADAFPYDRERVRPFLRHATQTLGQACTYVVYQLAPTS